MNPKICFLSLNDIIAEKIATALLEFKIFTEKLILLSLFQLTMLLPRATKEQITAEKRTWEWVGHPGGDLG
jgi:hypothetical protein